MSNPESFPTCQTYPTYPDSILKTLRKELNYIMDTTHTRILHWHSIKDELPTKSGEYIVFYEYSRRITINWFDKRTNTFLDAQITHWMPLPEPPKEEYGQNHIKADQ